MASVPVEATAAFASTWQDPKDVDFLQADTLPIPKVRRAWEREPRSPFNRKGKSKKVWKRYELRSKETTKERSSTRSPATTPVEGRSPQKVVKKLRIKGAHKVESVRLLAEGEMRSYTATRYDRRKSGLPRKLVMQRINITEECANTAPDDASEPENQDTIAEAGFAPIEEPLEEHVTDAGQLCEIIEAQQIQDDEKQVDLQETEVVEGSDLNSEETDASTETTSVTSIEEQSTQEPSISRQGLSQDGEPSLTTISISVTDTEDSKPLMEAAQSVMPNPPQSLINQESSTLSVEDGTDSIENSEVATQATATADLLPTTALSEDDRSVLEMSGIEFHPSPRCTPEALNMPELQFHAESIVRTLSDPIQNEPEVAEQLPVVSATDAAETQDSPNVSEEEEVAESTAATPIERTVEATSVQRSYDITEGLILFSSDTSGQKSHSSTESAPPNPGSTYTNPPPDLSYHFHDDTAVLMDFLDRAAANKANKPASITARESLSHRRDSGSIREALASPRKALETKDPNISSPSKETGTVSLEGTTTPKLAPPLSVEEEEVTINGEDLLASMVTSSPTAGSRRSARTRTSRVPHPQLAVAPAPNRIPVRCADGADPVVVKMKSDAQELAQLTRTNTKKNKRGAVAAVVRLLKLNGEKSTSPSACAELSSSSLREIRLGTKGVHWDEQLVYFQDPDAPVALIRPSTGQPRPLVSLNISSSKSTETRVSFNAEKTSSKTSSSTTRSRRAKGLGATNGTPGKALLTPASLLPMEVQDEFEKSVSSDAKAASKQQSKISRIAKLKTADDDTLNSSQMSLLPLERPDTAVLEVSEITASTEPKQRRSRLATPRRVRIPTASVPAGGASIQPTTNNMSTSGAVDGKENRLIPPKKFALTASVGAGTTVSAVAEEKLATGLPRRKAIRKA